MSSFLLTKKQPREVKRFARGHTARKQQDQGLDPDRWPQSELFNQKACHLSGGSWEGSLQILEDE